MGTEASAGLLRERDLLVLLSLDRFGRNYSEIKEEWDRITNKIKADIKVLDIPLLNTTIQALLEILAGKVELKIKEQRGKKMKSGEIYDILSSIKMTNRGINLIAGQRIRMQYDLAKELTGMIPDLCIIDSHILQTF